MKFVTFFLKRRSAGLRWGACLLAPAAVLAGGCQTSVSMETHIPALPPAAMNQPTLIANSVVESPSGDVDAGRDQFDPITKTWTASAGLATYLTACAHCHGTLDGGVKPDGAAADTPFEVKAAPGQSKLAGIAPGVPDLSDPEFSWTKTPQQYMSSLYTVPAHVADPKVKALDTQARWNVVAYSWALHSPLNDVVQGGVFFGRYCSVCHGTKGRGDGNLAGSLNPTPRQFIDFNWMVDKTDQRLYISISDGRPPSAMPAWKAALSPTQRIQIVDYIRQFSYLYPEDIQKKMAEQPPAA